MRVLVDFPRCLVYSLSRLVSPPRSLVDLLGVVADPFGAVINLLGVLVNALLYRRLFEVLGSSCDRIGLNYLVVCDCVS